MVPYSKKWAHTCNENKQNTEWKDRGQRSNHHILLHKLFGLLYNEIITPVLHTTSCEEEKTVQSARVMKNFKVLEKCLESLWWATTKCSVTEAIVILFPSRLHQS